MIRRMLELEGYQIVVLRSDEDALEVFGEGTPQALLAKESFLLCHIEAQIVTSLHDIALCLAVYANCFVCRHFADKLFSTARYWMALPDTKCLSLPNRKILNAIWRD